LGTQQLDGLIRNGCAGAFAMSLLARSKHVFGMTYVAELATWEGKTSANVTGFKAVATAMDPCRNGALCE